MAPALFMKELSVKIPNLLVPTSWMEFNKKFFPKLGYLPILTALIPLYWLVSQFAMTSPPLDLSLYKRAADFAIAGNSPYSTEFLTDDIYLPWVYTPFGTLVLLPLHYVAESLLLTTWTLIGILAPLVVIVLLGYQKTFSAAGFTRVEKKKLLVLLTLIAASTGPLIDAWAIGQIGVILVALTLFDLTAPNRWLKFKSLRIPRGIFAGVAGAIKLVPLIVIPYWIVSKQWREAFTATSTVVITWTLAFLVFPNDSKIYFVDKHFLGTNDVENVASTDNQSIIGTVMRITGIQPLPAQTWVPIFILIISLGLWTAVKTLRNGDQLAAGIIVGLTSVLASPVSWIHHIIWLVAVPGALLAGQVFKDEKNKITKAAWLWFASVIVIAIPPLRYGWSPVRRLGFTEQYSLLCIAVIWLLWWRSCKKLDTNRNQLISKEG
jgi:alpha-1,2-mannosyltransferase